MGPILTIVATFYNCEDEVFAGLNTVKSQSFSDYECIIVDDCSSDDTAERIRVWIHEFGDDRFRLHVNERNEGISRVRKRFGMAASGEFVAFQEAGDWSDPQRLAKQVAYMRANDDCAAVGCLFVNSVAETAVDYVRGARDLTQLKFENLLRQNRFAGGELVIRCSHLHAVGGFSDVLPYSEDYYLWLRLARNYRLHSLSEVLYRRDVRFKGLSFRPDTYFRQCLCVVASRSMAAEGDHVIAEEELEREGLERYLTHPSIPILLARGALRSAVIGDHRGAVAIAARVTKAWLRVAVQLAIPVAFLCRSFLRTQKLATS